MGAEAVTLAERLAVAERCRCTCGCSVNMIWTDDRRSPECVRCRNGTHALHGKPTGREFAWWLPVLERDGENS